MTEYKLNAMKREGSGKNRVDKLRAAGQIPAVIYQKGEENELVQVKDLEFAHVYNKAGSSSLVDLVVDSDTKKVLIKEVQRHPYRNEVLHVDFQGVRMDEAVRLMVPVVLLHRDEIRVQPSILLQMIDEIEVECLPGDIPAQAEVDVENMQIGDVITIADLDVSKNEKVNVLVDENEPVASLNEPQEEAVEEETEEESTEAADVPVVGEEEKEAEEE
ncbi:50S ribosomal protein L25 [Murdochiella massiliensis]|uniref:50S ribosomal protein L25 n=1 Tax=Murdochiella massiliensis TaxID=1673723 RepID=UPI000835C139|nr:50S ribosomal protein L25 [Murdochiella massiliensis]